MSILTLKLSFNKATINYLEKKSAMLCISLRYFALLSRLVAMLVTCFLDWADTNLSAQLRSGDRNQDKHIESNFAREQEATSLFYDLIELNVRTVIL